MAPMCMACRLFLQVSVLMFLFCYDVDSLLVYDRQVLLDLRLSPNTPVCRLGNAHKIPPPLLSLVPTHLLRVPVPSPRKRGRRRGKRSGRLVKLKARLAFGYAVPGVACRFSFPWYLRKPSYTYLVPLAGSELFPPGRTLPPCPRQRGVNLQNLRYVARASKSGDYSTPAKFGLVNARSVSNKTFILKEYFLSHYLDFLCLTETWITAGDSSAFAELLPSDCCYFNVPRRSGRGGGVATIFRDRYKCKQTDVIVNTISQDMNLSLGAVSKAILKAAGESLQDAIYSEARRNTQRHGEVVVTDGYNLTCHKVFHAVCPFWDNGSGQAEEELTSIIRYCLVEAEKCQMASLSFPAIGTGHLGFPRALVSKLLLREIRSYSSSRNPRCLREVVIVVHPSDSQTVDCFTREFTGQRNVQRERHDFNELPVQQPVSQSQHSSASFGPVLSTSLGVYQMQMGRLTLEVSSGDITKETSDVIVNSSNQTFDLKAGVSKAILDGAGITVEQECAQIVSSMGQSAAMILTSAGQLPSRNIIHVVGQNNPANIKNMVYSVLKFCEENNLSSVAFPALGTGQGGASPSAVADAMVDAVVEFVRKKQPRFVQSVKILIFQTAMLNHFHTSMKKRQGETVEEKSVFGKIKATVRQFVSGLVSGLDQSSSVDLVLEREEFEPTVFQLCADNNKALSQAKKRINDLIVAEQAQKTICDPFISQLSQADMEELKALQRKLTVSIRLDKGAEDQDPEIHLEGLTRDVFTAESAVRDIIRKVERAENSKRQALLVSSLVEWQFPDRSGSMVPFDIYTNLKLEEALEKKQKVKIKINNEMYTADPGLGKAVSANRRNLELFRKEVKDDTALPLPSCWEDMKGDLVKLFALTPGSQEYNNVEQELTKTGLKLNIISIERVQNPTLWQNYQILKKQMEAKNKHKNNEKLLFHGTKAKSVDLINNKGFNRSYAGTNVGAVIGKGSYFAVNPNYSAQGYASPDAKGHKRMYQAKVLVGDYTQGQQGMITPPAKSGSASDLYDSVTDNMSNPSMFVVFNDIQAYPEYLITFT